MPVCRTVRLQELNRARAHPTIARVSWSKILSKVQPLQRNCFHQSMYVLRCTLSVTCLIQLAYCLRHSYHKHTKRRQNIPKLISLFRSVVNCRNTKHDIDVTVKRRLSEHRKLVSLIKFVSTPLPLFKQTKTNFKKYLKRIEFNKEK